MDNTITGNPDDMLAAFYNDECRGVINGQLHPVYGYYYFPLTVYSNASSGEIMNYKFFQESSCEIFDLIETIEFLPDMIVGSMVTPFEFHYTSISDINVSLFAFLEGPFNGSSMTTYLNLFGLIPLSQPYNSAPWNYTGTENVESIPTDVGDWV